MIIVEDLHWSDQASLEFLLYLARRMSARLVVEESAEQFSFRHALTREALYGQLLALYAPHAAVDQFTRAITASGRLSLSPIPALYRLRGQAYDTLGNFDRARQDYETALNAAQAAGPVAWLAADGLGQREAGEEKFEFPMRRALYSSSGAINGSWCIHIFPYPDEYGPK